MAFRKCLRTGCPNGARPKGSYCSDRCRVMEFKLRRELGGLGPRERRRTADRAAKRAAREAGVIPSDVRLSYGRAVAAVAVHFAGMGMLPEVARARAEAVLREALPGRLREVVGE